MLIYMTEGVHFPALYWQKHSLWRISQLTVILPSNSTPERGALGTTRFTEDSQMVPRDLWGEKGLSIWTVMRLGRNEA